MKTSQVLDEEKKINSSLKEDIIKICDLYGRLTKQLSRDRKKILQYRIAKRKLNIYSSYLNGLKNIDRLSLLFSRLEEESND